MVCGASPLGMGVGTGAGSGLLRTRMSFAGQEIFNGTQSGLLYTGVSHGSRKLRCGCATAALQGVFMFQLLTPEALHGNARAQCSGTCMP